MRFDWRASAVAATVAFVLSVFSGTIGGVAFGALIVRAAIGAVVFGAGAAGVSYVIDRYIPDLKKSMQGGGEPAEPRGTTGNQVDIVVDDDVDTDGLTANDFELEEAEDAEAAADASSEPAEDDSEWRADAEEADGLDAVDATTSSTDQTAPSPDERASESGFTPGLAAQRVHTGDAEEEIAELEEAESDGVGEAPQNGGDASESVDERTPEAASTASLPDIEGFSGDFSEAPASDSDDEDTSEGSGEDPQMMARAIRTVLKREE
ncbi:MAG: hypothetical protein ACOC2D_02605 [Spirochaetota bacterium]